MASRRNQLAQAAEPATDAGRSQPKNQRTRRPVRRDRRCRKGRVAMSDEAKFRWLWERSFGGACHQNIGGLNKFLIRFAKASNVASQQFGCAKGSIHSGPSHQ